MVIILNGASSSGKSSIAKALQAALRDHYLHIGIDTFIGMMPNKANTLDQSHVPADGFYWRAENGVQKIKSGEFGKQVNAVYHSTVRHLAQCGLNVIVDDVMDGAREQVLWRESLVGIEHVFVAVECAIEMLEQRESTRCDRMLGSASEQASRVHDGVEYDFEVESTTSSSDLCAHQIKDWLFSRRA